MKIPYHINEINSYILGNLQTTKENLKTWASDDYLMDNRTVAKFWDEVEKATAVRIVGDYDTDGICASYILAYAVGHIYKGKPVRIRLPRRFSEGYGFNETIADEIREKDPKGTLIITVDNGITAGEILEKLEDDGYPVIVTDHHEYKGKVPNVHMVLNPKVKSCCESFDGDYWCGAGIAYKLSEQMLPEKEAKHISLFAGIATVGDVMPLIKGNWGLVKKTINAFKQGDIPPALTCLASMLGQDLSHTNVETFSYYLCPAFNAPGRLYDRGASQMLSYLFSPSVEKAKAIVKINNNRKELKDTQTKAAIDAIYERHLENNCPIWIDLPNLHEGIIGIIASGIVEKFNVPAVVLTEKEDGNLKGSARTAGDIHILNYLQKTGAEYISLGGHAGAAGLTISREEYQKAKLYQISKPKIEKVPILSIAHEEIPEICENLKQFEPFGEGNPNPLLSTIIDMDVDNYKLAGKEKNHLIIMDEGDSGPYKITNFSHFPNTLINKNKFVLSGTISETEYKDVEIPTFDGTDVTEFDLVEHEKGR